MKIEIEGRLARVLTDAYNELLFATAKFPPMHSMHEGYAVILEELEELKEHVFKKPHSKELAYYEAKQIAAMALRFMHDLEQMKAY